MDLFIISISAKFLFRPSIISSNLMHSLYLLVSWYLVHSLNLCYCYYAYFCHHATLIFLVSDVPKLPLYKRYICHLHKFTKYVFIVKVFSYRCVLERSIVAYFTCSFCYNRCQQYLVLTQELRQLGCSSLREFYGYGMLDYKYWIPFRFLCLSKGRATPEA